TARRPSASTPSSSWPSWGTTTPRSPVCALAGSSERGRRPPAAFAMPPSRPMSAAVRALVAADAPFTDHFYDYREHGGTAWAAEVLGLDEHAVIKTLVMEDDRRAPLVVLMHGDREVSTRALARALGAGSIRPSS